nr:MAG TPA: hypothetical protein [Caudoviricetes sp.]
MWLYCGLYLFLILKNDFSGSDIGIVFYKQILQMN